MSKIVKIWHEFCVSRDCDGCPFDGFCAETFKVTPNIWGDEEKLLDVEVPDRTAESKDDIYPLTLIKDRYNGAYSGGKWTAWNREPWFASDAVIDDKKVAFFWKLADEGEFGPIGRGDTPDEAIEDLRRRMAECNT